MTQIPVALPHCSIIHAEEFQSGLRDRILGGLVDFPGPTWQCILILSGTVTHVRGDHDDRIEGPAIIWTPKDDTHRIRASAGSNGALMVVGGAVLSNALGHKPEAAAIRLMAARDFALELSSKPEMVRGLEACFSAILREIASAQTGMETIIEAHIRILLVSLWRGGIHETSHNVSYPEANLTLERFRHLLEVHLRERWPVNRFAAELGISTDKLHDICTRNLGIAPQRLVQERLAFEAQALLQRSYQSFAEIANYLGFKSTSQFSSFFKAETGLAPGSFRKALRDREGAAELIHSQTYADWP